MREKAIRKSVKRFVPPTIKEVEDYMLEKKSEWPLKFIEFYAAKFWNYYEASGWKLNGGKSVKNWQACFNSQWQELRFDSVDVLKKMQVQQGVVKKVVVEKRNGNFTVDFMNEVLSEYSRHPTGFSEEQLSSYYQWMKEKGFIKLTNNEMILINETYKKQKKIVQGMAACVTMSFQKMINYQIKFRERDR